MTYLSQKKVLWFFSVVFAVSLCLFAAVGSVQDFSYYQPIIDRKPFGEVIPPDPKALAGKQSPEESFVKDFELKSIVEDSDSSLQVGILDKRNNKTFYLKAGERYHDISLVSVDYDAEEIVIKKENETATIKMRPLKSVDKDKRPLGAPQPVLPAGEPIKATAASAPSHRKPFFQGFQPVTNAAQAKPFESFFKPVTNANPNPFVGGSSPFKPVQTDGKPVSNPFEELIRRQREARARQQQQQGGQASNQPPTVFMAPGSLPNQTEVAPSPFFQPQQEQPAVGSTEGQGFFQPVQPQDYEGE